MFLIYTSVMQSINTVRKLKFYQLRSHRTNCILNLSPKTNDNIGKMKFVIFTIFAIIAMAAAASFQAGMQKAGTFTCTPLSLPCKQDSQCCRHLECVKHANICVPQKNPSEDDTRDEGPKMPY